MFKKFRGIVQDMRKDLLLHVYHMFLQGSLYFFFRQQFRAISFKLYPKKWTRK